MCSASQALHGLIFRWIELFCTLIEWQKAALAD
jgi:hypothetical protein